MKQVVKLHAVTNVHNAARGEAEGIVYYHVFDVTYCVCVRLSCHGSNRFGIPTLRTLTKKLVDGRTPFYRGSELRIKDPQNITRFRFVY